MPSRRFRPLDVDLAFANRRYRLGDTIDVSIELTARTDVEVREGRIDLLCKERWSESYTKTVPVRTASVTVSMRNLAPIPPVVDPSTRITRQLVRDHEETYVHSSVVFLQDRHLPAGATRRYSTKLEILSELPPHIEMATLRWQVVAAIDVALARDITRKRSVKVEVEREPWSPPERGDWEPLPLSRFQSLLDQRE